MRYPEQDQVWVPVRVQGQEQVQDQVPVRGQEQVQDQVWVQDLAEDSWLPLPGASVPPGRPAVSAGDPRRPDQRHPGHGDNIH